MKILRTIYTLCAAALLCSGCQDEEMIKQSSVKEGIPVTIDLTFSAVVPKQEAVGTRATTDPEYRVNDLYVLIFNKNTEALKGEVLSYDYSELNSTDPEGNKQNDDTETLVGTLNSIETTTGESVIYAIANVNNPPSEYNITDDVKTAITNVQTIDDLEKIVVKLRDRNANAVDRIYETRYIMSGSLTCTIDENGISGSDKDIPLFRTDSYVTFIVDNEVKDTKCTNFSLLSYRIYNIPVGTSLVSLDDKNYDDGVSDKSANYWNFVEAEQTGGNTFNFYLPENVKQAKESFTDYASRDLCNKNPDGTNGSFKYAPDYGTYVVLHGIYEGTASTTQDIPGVENEENAEVRASVDYIIHLGNFGKNVTDFSNKRNVHYTYTIHVKGVDDIVVEVETSGDENPQEPEPGAEGDVFFRTGIFYNLDCHNEPVLMEFTAQEIQNVGAQADEYIQYWISSPFGDKEDKHWLHFVLNEEAGNLMPYPGDEACKSADEATNGIHTTPGNVTVMSLDGLMTALNDILTKNSNSDYANNSGGISVTCFVNEYVYDDKSWAEYVNQSNREAYIFGRVTYSKDQNSSTILTKYTISQRSIKTPDAYYENGIGLGIETVNETGDLPMGNPSSGSGSYPDSDENGLQNTLSMFGTQTWWSNNAVDVSNIPWGHKAPGLENYQTMGNAYEYAAYACLMRNRDENGNRSIDADEVKWYLPAIDQYAAVYAGSTALATEAQLYTQWDVVEKTHYLSSTWGVRHDISGPWIVWAEEGYNTQVLPGDNNDYTDDNDDGDEDFLTNWKRPYRCIRNLFNKETDRRTGFYGYDEDTRIITIYHQQDYRGYDAGAAFDSHNQIGDENRFYYQFKVAEKYLEESYRASEARVGNPCSSYSENGEDRWRMPNQRELMAMYAAGVFEDLKGMDGFGENENKFVHCQTVYNFYHSGNDKYGYAVQQVAQDDEDPVLVLIRGQNQEGYIRCVRDVE